MNMEVKSAYSSYMATVSDSSQVPVQILTSLVLAELLSIREASQREQVEFMAQQNEKSKEYNQLMGHISLMMTAYTDEKADTARSLSKDSPNPIPAATMELFKTTMNNVAKNGGSFEAALKEMKLPEAQSEYLMGRAKLADAAKELNLLPGGANMRDYSALAQGGIQRGALEAVKNGIKASAEGITTNSQLFMIKLQQLVSLVDAIKTALSQFVKTSGDSQKEIAQKL